MMRKLAMVAAVACALAMVTTVEAAKGKKSGGKKPDLFAQLDTDKDGKISKEEFGKLGDKGKQSAKTDKAFDKLDKNKDGYLDRDEFAGHAPKPDAPSDKKER